MKGHAFVDPLGMRHSIYFADDFVDDIDSTRYTITATDSGTGAVAGAHGGVLPLVASDGTVADNDETYVESVNEFISFVANQPWHFWARIQFTEANVDDANIAIGLGNAPGANSILDDGGGIATGMTSNAVLFKTDGSNKWKCTAGGSAATQAANVKTSHKDASPGVAGVAGPWQWVEIIWTPLTTTTGKVTFRVDGEILRDSSLPHEPIIEIPVTITGSATMALWAGVKNGGANLETLNIDCWGIQGRRSGLTA